MTKSHERDLTFWDLIVNTCYLVGGIPYFIGDQLAVRPAATVYDRLRGPIDPVRNPTPFSGGQTRALDAVTKEQITPALRVRRIVYGRDIMSLKFGRKLGGRKRPKIIRVIATDQSSAAVGVAKQVRGFWPPDDAIEAHRTRRSPGKEVSMSEVEDFPAPGGIVDPEQLTAIARAIYEEIGRGEIGGECVTKNLSSFGGDNQDPDLLKLDPGDGVEVLSDTREAGGGAPLVSTYTDWSRASFEAMVKEIAGRLGDENLARVIVATARGQVNELQRFFRVENVKFDADITRGVKISFDFQNYVIARNQVGDANSQPGAASLTATPNSQASATQPGSTKRGQSLRGL